MENNKCLYWRRIIQTINGNKYPICVNLEYGIIPQDEKWEYKTFDELWQNKDKFSCYSHAYKKLFSKEQVRKLYYSTAYGYKNKRLQESDFESASLEIKYDKCAIDYSIKNISERLTAEMFFDYCKDNMTAKSIFLTKGMSNNE